MSGEIKTCGAADNRMTNLDSNETAFRQLRASVNRLADTKAKFLGQPIEVDEKDAPCLFPSIESILREGPEHLNNLASTIDAINDELRDRLS